MSSAALTPRVRVMLACEKILARGFTDDVFDLKGIHYALRTLRFPFVATRLWLFLVLSSPRPGRFPGTVRVIHDRSDRTVFEADLNPVSEFPGDQAFHFATLRLRCRFREPGRYTIQLSFSHKMSTDVVKGEMPFYVLEEGE
jgi:hypothetical protein